MIVVSSAIICTGTLWQSIMLIVSCTNILNNWVRMANEDHRKQTRVIFLLLVNDGGRDIATQCVRGILRNSTHQGNDRVFGFGV